MLHPWKMLESLDLPVRDWFCPVGIKRELSKKQQQQVVVHRVRVGELRWLAWPGWLVL